MSEIGNDAFFEELYGQVEIKVLTGLMNSLTVEECNIREEARMRTYGRYFGENKIDRKKYEESLERILKNPANVTFTNPHDFLLAERALKEQGYLEPSMKEQMQHEIEHMNKARELGFIEPSIGFYFHDTKEGDFKIQYFCNPGHLPPNMPDKEIIMALKEITTAPTKLSPGDANVLAIKSNK
ncbi:MAG: hypothetical protein NTV98_02465 [Candidatus Roizmanbacteria bacterium]|nr:hypothetical protein [Candidatus Roizmanbacteria bacterium]